MRNIKNQKGITLVALVVTIIILIILAGVSINAIIGENGVITLAKRAKENIELAQAEEEQSLNQLFDDFELQESQIDGTGSYVAVLRLNEFKKKIADYIDEAAKGSIDLTNEYIKPDHNTASIEAFGNAIKQIVKEVTKDATATADDISNGKTAWVNGQKIVGTLSNENIKSFYFAKCTTKTDSTFESSNSTNSFNYNIINNYIEITDDDKKIKILKDCELYITICCGPSTRATLKCNNTNVMDVSRSETKVYQANFNVNDYLTISNLWDSSYPNFGFSIIVL